MMARRSALTSGPIGSRGRLWGGVLLTVAAVCREQVRSLCEQVVTEIHDHKLWRERLSRGPGRALALASSALRAGGEVEHRAPLEVLDLAHAEDVVLARILEVHWLAARQHRQEWT